MGNTWAGQGSIPVVFFPGMAGHPCLILHARPFPSKENQRISERDDLGPPFVPGVRRSVWDPETSRELIGDWGGPETVWALLCVAARRATRPNGEGSCTPSLGCTCGSAHWLASQDAGYPRKTLLQSPKSKVGLAAKAVALMINFEPRY